jgi:hypothetical protein
MSATADRNVVFHIAQTAPERALRLARGIRDPWFRCQALSYVAEHERDRRLRKRLIQEALGAAAEEREPNRVVTVSAWPLQVMARVRDVVFVRAEVGRLLNLIATESNPVRRGDAIFMLLDKLRDGPRDVFTTLLDALQAACLATHPKAWKREWLMRNAVEIAATIDPARARALAELIQQPRLRRKALEAIEP